ncbi:MAG: D-alanine--D-alanine ligase [Candidatus Krumholzibacteria bacterium]|nr:D-alanine--D-alanine ligase [Candidatus Krumholzibacteria bacterium]MDP6669974.1 D-alanine--D-alanine ligase [Candidatus Krumholzibacteria bacterium]MDP6797160.1 D-alanine--D-alanine ligase [Candidatus Krumholzibacteria bacterium]MDP7022530.1 D-alanine--D-alanine ligase [Candidatus Krumholzibacteria bacterium]
MSRIALLMGGESAEREISLLSGRAVGDALRGIGHEVRELDPAHEDLALAQGCDLVFVALHGGEGENGTLQARLGELGLAYTGSGPAASRLAMDKSESKRIAAGEGIQSPAGFLQHYTAAELASPATILDLRARIESEIGYPAVAKPNREGSSVGLALLHGREDSSLKLPRVLAASGEILVEKFIEGRELTVAILGDRALPALEILPESGLYDYRSKYEKGQSRYECPARLSGELSDSLAEQSLRIYRSFGCRGFARVDWRLDPDDSPYFLELNTIPGMTATSLVPMAAAAAGLDFPALVAEIADLAME